MVTVQGVLVVRVREGLFEASLGATEIRIYPASTALLFHRGFDAY